jgi:hypothetical protein
MTISFSLRIFVADGDPDGLRIVDRSNWNGKALVFPRAAWAQTSVAARADMQVFLAHLLAKRQELIDLGVLAQQGSDHAFTQDYTFSSPSTAACVVLGRSTNGRLEWKDAQGRALKVLQKIN